MNVKIKIGIRMYKELKVSIIITTYKRDELLKRSLESAINQTYSNIEIVVIDDYVDSKLDINNLMGKQINNFIYIKNNINKKISGSRNNGIKNSTGDIVTFMDDDDEMLPTKIEELVLKYQELKKENTEFSFLFTKNIIKTKYLKYINNPPLLVTDIHLLYYNAVLNNFFCEREKLIKSGCYREDYLYREDAEIVYRLTKQYGPAYCINKPLHIIYKDHVLARSSSDKEKVFRMNRKFYFEYKNDFSKKHKEYFFYKYLRSKKNKLIIPQYFVFWVPFEMYKREIIQVFYGMASVLYNKLKK